MQKQKITFDATQGDLNEKSSSQISRMSMGIENNLSQMSRLSMPMNNAFATGNLTLLNNSMGMDNNLSQTSRSSMTMNNAFANGNLSLLNNTFVSEENTQHYHPVQVGMSMNINHPIQMTQNDASLTHQSNANSEITTQIALVDNLS